MVLGNKVLPDKFATHSSVELFQSRFTDVMRLVILIFPAEQRQVSIRNKLVQSFAQATDNNRVLPVNA